MTMRSAIARRSVGARVLGPDDLDDALAVCAEDPVASVLAASQLVAARTTGIPPGSEVLGYVGRDGLTGVCWSGANLVPVRCGPAATEAIAPLLRRRGRRCSSIVGDAAAVDRLWSRLSGWGPARDIREGQLSMMTDRTSTQPPDLAVRLAGREDFDLVYPACVAMFTEEVGYSPTAHGGGPGYAARVHALIAQERALVRIDDTPHGPTVVFKAEIGAVALGVAQIQGVWVHPDYRGRGIGTRGMAAVVEYTRARIAPVVSLYVNDFNAAAIALYRSIGFDEVGRCTTVLF